MQQPPTDYQETDIFAWSNNMLLYKDQLQSELFLLSKNNVVYSTKYDTALLRQMSPLFLDRILEYVINGAGEGLVVRGFEDAEGEDHVLQRTRVSNVEKLVEAMHWLQGGRHQVESFSEADHDLKHMRGLIVAYTHPQLPRPFYVIKLLSPAQVVKGMGAWLGTGGGFQPLETGAVLRVPADNQLLIIDDDLYVFNQNKLERLFGYNAKKHAIAEKKVAQIQANFNLSFGEEQTLQTMIKDNKAAINKLQKIDPTAATQDQLLDHAEELGIELMTDDAGAIIITDKKDLTKFVNLLNDDYVESGLTGRRYEIRSKKLLPQND